MARGRPRQKQRCINNNPIGRDHWTAANTGAIGKSASCSACQAGPLHLESSMCGCVFRRAGRLVCRACAIGFDLFNYGKSKIHNDLGEIDPEVLEAIQRGYRVVHF